MGKRLFRYVGPVMIFDRCVCSNWCGETYAVSEARAMSNLRFQYKLQNNLAAGAKVTLDQSYLLIF